MKIVIELYSLIHIQHAYLTKHSLNFLQDTAGSASLEFDLPLNGLKHLQTPLSTSLRGFLQHLPYCSIYF